MKNVKVILTETVTPVGDCFAVQATNELVNECADRNM